VVLPDGTFVCAAPAMGGGEPPLATPPAEEPEEEPDEPEQQCPQGWTKTPIPGKCCPHGTVWTGERCKRGETPPEPESEPEPEPEPEEPTPPSLQCWRGWLQIDADQRKAYLRKGYKVRSRRHGKRTIWCAMEGTKPPPPALNCPPPAIGKLPFCKCGRGHTGKWPKCRKLPDKCPSGYVGTPPNCNKEPPKTCPKGYVGTPPNCRKLPVKCPSGYVGTPPNCKKEPPKTCPSGYVGTPPNCRKLPVTCPKGYVGKPPNCKKVVINKLINNLKSKKN
jgi:hypothetical protein